LVSPARLIDIRGIEELRGITIGNSIRIGALTHACGAAAI
jgi:CO/xanthine dehydrogenase FAD-binding subunit